MSSGKENLIKIDEVIKKAKEKGVDFGNANPRSRLRYYAKLDLLPSAERKVFDGNQPTGAYPPRVIDLLVEINEKIEEGKSIKKIAEEKKEEQRQNKKNKKEEKEEQEEQKVEVEQITKKADEKAKEDFKKDQEENPQKAEVSYQAPPFTLIPTYQKGETESDKREEQKEENEVEGKNRSSAWLAFSSSALKFITLALVVAVFGYTLGSGMLGEKIPFRSLASLTSSLVQVPVGTDTGSSPAANTSKGLLGGTPEPYLTFNAETDINAPLNLTGGTSTPTLSFQRNNYEGILTVDPLTADRSYQLPDQSGTVCLSSGNCIEGNRITSSGGSVGRLPRFSSSNTIENSSIQDLYQGGTLVKATQEGVLKVGGPLQVESDNTSFFMNGEGQIGIGVTDPEHALEVQGTVYATEDLCIDGKCLSEVSGSDSGMAIFGGGGINGEGSAGYLTRWTDTDEVGISKIYQSGKNIGINNTSPSSALDVGGTLTIEGFKMPTNATSNYVLTATSTGEATWQPLPVTRPKGVPGQTLRHNGDTWMSNSFLTNLGDKLGVGTATPSSTLTVVGTTTTYGQNTIASLTSNLTDNSAVNSPALTFEGHYDATTSTTSINAASVQFSLQNVTGYNSSNGSSRLGLFSDGNEEFSFNDKGQFGIGTSSPAEALTVAGSGLLKGSLTLSTSSLPQLTLRNGTNSLKFNTATDSTEIVSTQNMTINSLGGEVSLGDAVNLLNATNATVTANTFISHANDATVRSSDEYVLRASVPVYPYSMPAQTATGSYIRISKHFSVNDSLASTTPSVISGASRKYAFLINYTDDAATSTSLDWRIYREGAGTTTQSFSTEGQNLSSLNEGNPYLTNFYSLPDNDWQLGVNPHGNDVRVFNVLLLAYDQVN